MTLVQDQGQSERVQEHAGKILIYFKIRKSVVDEMLRRLVHFHTCNFAEKS